jgi:hypothetical protein
VSHSRVAVVAGYLPAFGIVSVGVALAVAGAELRVVASGRRLGIFGGPAFALVLRALTASQTAVLHIRASEYIEVVLSAHVADGAVIEVLAVVAVAVSTIAESILARGLEAVWVWLLTSQHHECVLKCVLVALVKRSLD